MKNYVYQKLKNVVSSTNQINEADFYKDDKSGKFGKIETGLEVETVPTEITYDVSTDTLSEIIDKLKASSDNTMDFDNMDKEVIARKIVTAILTKYLKPSNIEIEDIQGEQPGEMVGEKPELGKSMVESVESFVSFGEFSTDEYKDKDDLETAHDDNFLQEEIEVLKDKYDADEEMIEDFTEKFREGEVMSADEYIENYTELEEDEQPLSSQEDFESSSENDIHMENLKNKVKTWNEFFNN